MSPDWNPIQHLWGTLKRQVEHHFPSSIQALKEAVLEEWKKMLQYFTKLLIPCLKTRCSPLKTPMFAKKSVFIFGSTSLSKTVDLVIQVILLTLISFCGVKQMFYKTQPCENFGKFLQILYSYSLIIPLRYEKNWKIYFFRSLKIIPIEQFQNHPSPLPPI